MTLCFTLNGQPTRVECPDGISLLDLLRDRLHVVSPKNGCQPMGQCGGCAVLLDGRVVLACVTPAAKVENREVVTVDGLDSNFRDIASRCFVAAGGIQCGFCTPGILIRTWGILHHNPRPTRDEIARALVGHLCRCTGYKKIIDAIDLTARVLRGEATIDFDMSGRVGTSLPRYRGVELALGQKPFVDDIYPDNCLYGAPVFSAHPRAIIKSIDLTETLNAPGVVGALTAKDLLPGRTHHGLIYRDWPVFIDEGQVTHCVGDFLAVIAAETPQQARAAAKLARIEYEVLEPLTDPEIAMQPDAPVVHPDTHPQGNLLSDTGVKRGEPVDTIFPQCAHVVEETFYTQRIEHAFLEPEAAIAYPWRDGVLEVLSQGQGVFEDQRQIAEVLGVDRDSVKVTLVSNGGAFGGKEDLSVQAHAALLAHKFNRPAKITLTREQSLRLHPKRHPVTMKYKVGCDAEGRILAVRGRIIGDKGAYASVGTKVIERAGGHATGPYNVPNLEIEALAVYTNNPPCGAMRGFGVNQASFAMEGCLDRLAEKIGLDGWEIRWRNAMETGDTFCSGQVLDKPIGLKKTLLAVRDVYRGAKLAGIACGIKNVGIGNGMADTGQAVIRVEEDGEHLTVYNGFTEMGQGLLTVIIQSVVEVIPTLDASKIDVVIDTSRAVPCGMTTASRGTVLACLAAKHAAENLKSALDDGATLRDLAGREFFGEIVFDYTVPLGHTVGKNGGPIRTHITFGFATQVVLLNDDGTLKKVVAAHDVGRVMNPKALEGQIEGAVHMGLGYALTEEFIVEGGHVKSTRMNDLGIIRAHHTPEVECIFVEEADPETPWGAKGVGEIGLVPTAGAVAGALHAFDGKWRTRLPMKDSAAARAILGQKKN